MKVVVGLCLLGCAFAAKLDVKKRASPIEVKLESVGNSAVKASVTNTGSEPLKLFKVGTVLDSLPTEKVEIHSAATSEKVAFDGVRLSIDETNVIEDKFVMTVNAGETVENMLELAEVHDLSAGGAFHIRVLGKFLTVDPVTKLVNGAVTYDSNVLTSHVDGTAALQVRRAFNDDTTALLKRHLISSACDPQQSKVQDEALGNCEYIARKGMELAATGPLKVFTEYFMVDNKATRDLVSATFSSIRETCNDRANGPLGVHCMDVMKLCNTSRSFSYMSESRDLMVMCPSFFDGLKGTTPDCRGQSQPLNIIHQTSHLSYAGATQDFAVGYDDIRKLVTDQAVANADSYRLFANAAALNCY